MKKYLVSPLCSALVVPGLGQIINGQTKKGIVILIVVFLFIVALTVDLALTLQSVLRVMDLSNFTPRDILTQFRKADLVVLAYLCIAFGALWLYALLDALWVGIRLERKREG